MGDVVLLPYDPEVYKTRGSGVFSEAEALGVPVVVTQGCGFAAQAVKDGWAQEIVKNAPESVADALFGAFCRLPEMKARAKAAANKVQAQKLLGATFRSILDSLMAEERSANRSPIQWSSASKATLRR
jgi:glycosyltransferase involved in cell wall biosynthesis